MIGTLLASVLVLADVKVAVVCVDLPGYTCSTVQPRLEAEFAKLNKIVVPVPAAGPIATPPTSEPALVEAKKAMDDGVRLFYEGRIPEAKAALEKANQTISRVSLPAKNERIEINLWRATVAFAGGEVDPGTNAVEEAVRLDPDYQLNTSVFPAALKDVVEGRKNALRDLARTEVTFTNIRSGYEIKIDDKRVDISPETPTASLLKSRHWVTVTAPGYRPLWRSFDASTETSISLALAPGLSEADEAAVKSRNVNALKSLAGRVGADILVITTFKQTTTGVGVGIAVLNPSPDGGEGGPYPRENISGMVAFAGPKLVVKGRGPVVVDDGEPKGYRLHASGALAMSVWQRDFHGDFGASQYEQVNLVGVGPRVAVDFQLKGLIARADATFLHYGMNTIESNVDAASPAKKGPGGSGTHFAVGVGYQHEFGERRDAGRARVGALVGFDSEFYKSVELKSDPSTGREEVLPMYGSHDRSGPFVRVEGAYPAGKVLLRGGAGIWLADYREKPEVNGVGANGEIKSFAPVPQINLGVDYGVNAKLSISGEVRAQIRQVTYEDGVSSLAVPDVEGGTLDETLDTISVTARWKF